MAEQGKGMERSGEAASRRDMTDAEMERISGGRAAGGDGFDFVQVNGSNTAGDYYR